jgi:hypothetical protein
MMPSRSIDSRPPNRPKIHLYFSPKCDFSRELISIISDVPVIARNVYCVDVLNYKVLGISTVPAIDDGVSKQPHEGQAAFMWIMNRYCNAFYI